MSRAKSVVLTAAEKKGVVSKLKADIKALTEGAKAINAKRKEADKVFQAASKANVAVLKSIDKELAANDKAVTGLKAQLASLTAPAVAA